MENLTQDSAFILQIWNDIKTGGVPFIIILIVTGLVFFKRYFIMLFDLMIKRLSRKYQTKEYTRDEVLRHPIFRNLEFWLSVGIDSITFRTIAIPSIALIHPEDSVYSIVKEDIAKDLLRIKFETIKETINEFIKEFDFSSIEKQILKGYIENSLEKCKIKQQKRYVDSGIPAVFLTKYLALERVSEQILLYSLQMFFDSNLALTNNSIVYLMMNVMDNYLTTIFNNVSMTIQSINGDLKGCSYKGKVIGQKPITVMKPPHPSFSMIVQKLLVDILNKYSASRAYIIKYYANKEGEKYYSCVYEVCDKGITSEIKSMQKVPTTIDCGEMKVLEDGHLISVDISKFNNFLSEKFSKRGADAVIMVPIIVGGRLSGALILEYVNIETFNSLDIEKIEDDIVSEAGKMKPYIEYPKDYDFEEERVKNV